MSLKAGDVLVRRCQPAEPDGFERLVVIGSAVPECIGVRPVDAIAGGHDVRERDVLENYDVEIPAEAESDSPRLSWWVT